MRLHSVTTALIAAMLGAGFGCSSERDVGPSEATNDLTGVRFLGDSTGSSGFARAMEPRDFVFPRDHGPHPRFRNEWWYFTGNLYDEDRRHFGFELTFFRIGLTPTEDESTTTPADATIWMAHFAVTDSANGAFHAAERLARGNATLAFARASPPEVRVEDWHLLATAPDVAVLQAADAGYSIELSVESIGDIVAQGDRGLDRKGPEDGNASYYYSAPRLRARGRLAVPGSSPQRVEGTAWLDREWGTSALSPGIVGWDWFALQLNDGRDLMYYQLRNADGEPSVFSGGTIRSQQGDVIALSREDVDTEVLERWQSPTSGVSYPVRWRLSLPAHELELEVSPVIPNQELDLTVRYWEGAMSVEGSAGDRPVRGRGYLELAGYQ